MKIFVAGAGADVWRWTVALVMALAVAVIVAGCGADLTAPFSGSEPVSEPVEFDPLAYDEGFDAEYEGRAAAGESHVLYARSPGGVAATARRVERLRALVESAAGEGDVDPDLLEAIVFLESAGRADVIAGDDPEAASGLTQILAETGQGLLGMRIDLAASRRLTRRYQLELRRGRPAAAARALAARRRVDERFVPARALAATVRYLEIARERLGRDDLAVVAYHMGIGNLSRALAAYGGERPSYARLYFDSSPLRNAAAWDILDSLGDDSATYYWRVLAAREIMRLHREDPEELARLALAHTAKGSAEEVLHPLSETETFAEPGDIATAREDGELVALPPPTRLGMRPDRRLGELAPRLRQPRALYLALRPQAVSVAAYFGRTVREISGQRGPLILTSAVRDQRYQDLLAVGNPEATRGYSLHTTGFAFDIRRRYRSRAQGRALQFVLDRFETLNLIAWVREPGAIHVTVAEDALVNPAR
jgi:hypothetical protein